MNKQTLLNKKWEKINQSPNYKNGSFQNLSHTSVMSSDVSFIETMKFFFNRPKSVSPPKPLPNVKTDLKSICSEKPVIIWFGHSSYLMHIKGVNILVDPVFSGSASPMPFLIKAFPGSNAYSVEDLPQIDLLIITHNHYDHLDKKTVKELKHKVNAIYTPLGVGNDLERCIIKEEKITELDWWNSSKMNNEIEIIATPARHFSGRGLKRGESLWASFVLNIFGYNIYLGGDSGYDTHFKKIGQQYGPFDLAVLECGQYNTAWPFIHMAPEETVQASIDLNAKVLLPVHWAKFALAYHDWDEPIKRITKIAAEKNVDIITPMIGEPVTITEHYTNSTWWEI
ncbi:L-ascorbate metabolism protein UlaG, beta-lactamase superfamily [Solitalea koreensis]|uniref:L-ascorbate metabolism protein UlaG, beta-lactamase superfamily n=2 Tax=Solitalea koreensis TaxID=543615 RepID=A0A521BIH4_9SPHI|nr:L-ascorbate metabolism protein UlaG, beta-lactamase superfamily [Solitalea koreensis]